MKKLDDLKPRKETLKQKIQLKAQRMRRYEEGTKFYRQNNTFETDKKKFYRELVKSQVNIEKPSSNEKVETFWSNIWGTEKDYNEEAEWLKREEERCEGLEQQEWDEIKVDEVKEVLGKAPKWKSPGKDKVPNFWLNTLNSIHENMTNCFNRAIANPETNPHTYHLNLMKRTSLKTIDLSHAYQPCIKFYINSHRMDLQFLGRK